MCNVRYSLLGITLIFALCSLLCVICFSCLIDPRPPVDDNSGGFVSFPEAEILGAAFYTKINNIEYTGDDAGNITKNEDGSYAVKIRRRDTSSTPSMFTVTGSFEYSDYYRITCSFPEDADIKPFRVYACGSRGMDAAVDADYRTARDLNGSSAWPTGYAQGGPIIMSNEGINTLTPDRKGRPYITVFLYFYFQTASNMNDPDDWYNFTLHSVRGANGIIPESRVTKAEVYRSGDTEQANKFTLENTVTNTPEGVTGDPILARYNHRFDSVTISLLDTQSLIIDLEVPASDTGREMEVQLRNIGLFSGTENLLVREMIKSAAVQAGITASEQTGVVVEVAVSSTPVSYYYKVKAKIVVYPEFTGLKIVIPGTPQLFSDTNRFTCTLYLPDEYIP